MSEPNVDKLSVEVKYIKSDVDELKQDVKELKQQSYETKVHLVKIDQNIESLTNVMTKIDKTIEDNKKKWSSNINTWVDGGVSVIISILVTYIANNLLNVLK